MGWDFAAELAQYRTNMGLGPLFERVPTLSAMVARTAAAEPDVPWFSRLRLGVCLLPILQCERGVECHARADGFAELTFR